MPSSCLAAAKALITLLLAESRLFTEGIVVKRSQSANELASWWGSLNIRNNMLAKGLTPALGRSRACYHPHSREHGRYREHRNDASH
jgi:hypothetical protein